MLNAVMSTNFSEMVPQMIILGHLDRGGAQNRYGYLSQVKHDLKLIFFFMRRLMYTRHACFIHLNSILMSLSGAIMGDQECFPEVVTFLLKQWPTSVARILTILSCLLVCDLGLSVFINCFVISNILNWVEVR